MRKATQSTAASTLQPTAASAAVAAANLPPTPTFREFATQWVAEHQIEWRRSHLRTLKSTLDGHLLPAFGERCLGKISKADILGFRARLAELPGRTRGTISNKRINGILAPVRQILNEAAERFDFPSRCRI